MITEQEAYDRLTDYLSTFINREISNTSFLKREFVPHNAEFFWFESNHFKWTNNGVIQEIIDDGVTQNRNHWIFKLEREFEVAGKFDYQLETKNYENYFSPRKLKYISYMNIQGHLSSEIRDEGLQTINEYNNLIYSTYNKHNLMCLTVRNCLIEGLAPITYFTEKTKGKTPVRGDSNWHKQYNEVITSSKDVKYCLGELLLYHQYMDSNLFEHSYLDGRDCYSIHIDDLKRRYLQYTNILYEKIYNYWDKIGDLLDFYIDTNLDLHKVGFPLVIQKIKSTHPHILRNSSSFKWLYNFKNKEFKTLNKVRKKIVHYHYIETELKEQHLHNTSNREKIKELEEEFYGYADYFKEHLDKTLEGYKHALIVIEKYAQNTSENL